MGLIKTAIMTGGGIYAVKQLARTVDRRQDNPAANNQNYPRDGGYQNQGQWGPPGPPPPPPRGPPQVDNRYADYQQQQSYSNNAAYGRGFSAGDYDGERAPATEVDYQYQDRNRQIAPPSYYPQQGNEQYQNQYQNQYQTKNQNQSQNQSQNFERSQGNDGRASQMDGLMDMALEFAGSNGVGRKGKKS